jgi:hypothetical protein
MLTFVFLILFVVIFLLAILGFCNQQDIIIHRPHGPGPVIPPIHLPPLHHGGVNSPIDLSSSYDENIQYLN